MELLNEIAAGRLTKEEAFGRYELSPEELESWQSAYERHGIGALRITRSRLYHGTKELARRKGPPGANEHSNPTEAR